MSKWAAAGQLVIGNNSTGPLVQVSFLKRRGKNIGDGMTVLFWYSHMLPCYWLTCWESSCGPASKNLCSRRTTQYACVICDNTNGETITFCLRHRSSGLFLSISACRNTYWCHINSMSAHQFLHFSVLSTVQKQLFCAKPLEWTYLHLSVSLSRSSVHFSSKKMEKSWLIIHVNSPNYWFLCANFSLRQDKCHPTPIDWQQYSSL